ncbi:hypothetical protein LWC34_39870 [Kibdelosporangium philippinense]|uniref:Uncharacterized protein n=1 Tax=Kibdelosporangium philippinense TaxID=211113 RepID=A0ABS8ZMX7_9PSEU|nr:hypothetical protein [Kibdelosporangium philippinense]MCE7008927.1 hypothetical protein [Kibdelosporangium philippinense]
MSTYPTTPAHGNQPYGNQPVGNQYAAQPMGPAPTRPGTLLAALVVTVLAGLSAVAYGAIILIGGADLARELGAKAVAILTGDSAESILAEGNALLDTATIIAQDTLDIRAWLLIVPGGLLLLFGLLMGKASTAVRVLATIAASFTLLFGGIVGLDSETNNTIMAITSWVAALGAVVCIVLMWLSPNGRYGKALKQRA